MSKKFYPPTSAENNAQKALDWKDEHGDDVKGGTEVGWKRARQLASGEGVSKDIVHRMAQFNRHRSNRKVKDEHKGEPWKDKGHVAWLIWGGTSGVDWAIKMSKVIKKEGAAEAVERGLNHD